MFIQDHFIYKRRPHKRAAFSLIEAAIVLGIVGLVIGGLWVAASKAMDSLKVTQIKEELLANVQKIRKLAAGNCIPHASGMTQTLYDMGIIRADQFDAAWPQMRLGMSYEGEPTGLVFDMLDPSGNGGCAQHLALNFNGVPVNLCVELGTQLSAVLKSDFISFETLHGGNYYNFTNFPLSPSDITQYCGGGMGIVIKL